MATRAGVPGDYDRGTEIMPDSKSQRRKPPKKASSQSAQLSAAATSTPAFPNVPGRWLLWAAALAIFAAIACGWLTLCLLYWQGSWQLLYHPAHDVMRTPASVNLAYEPVRFAATETGTAQLTGWWIPAASDGPRTILYLHGADGNLGDSVDELKALHELGLPVFAFDYRGYGQSAAGRPSEARMRQDAAWALDWLTGTKHIAAEHILLYGSGLGANLAAEVAAGNSKLAGVILEAPIDKPMAVVLNDPRSRLVPARWMVEDRYDLERSASSIQVPSLWILAQSKTVAAQPVPAAYGVTRGSKSALWLGQPAIADPHFHESLQRWLDDLPSTR
jgi:uncharacterized protein